VGRYAGRAHGFFIRSLKKLLALLPKGHSFFAVLLAAE